MLWSDLPPRQRIFPITQALWLGPFASPERRSTLIQAGITDVLNVSDAPNVLAVNNGDFQSAVWIPIEDLTLLDRASVIDCLSILHRMIIRDDSQVYVHCMAGQNRSATIVWLYLIGCGVDQDAAKRWIVAASFDSVPGHSRLLSAELLQAVLDHGRSNFQPNPRPAALLPARKG